VGFSGGNEPGEGIERGVIQRHGDKPRRVLRARRAGAPHDLGHTNHVHAARAQALGQGHRVRRVGRSFTGSGDAGRRRPEENRRVDEVDLAGVVVDLGVPVVQVLDDHALRVSVVVLFRAREPQPRHLLFDDMARSRTADSRRLRDDRGQPLLRLHEPFQGVGRIGEERVMDSQPLQVLGERGVEAQHAPRIVETTLQHAVANNDHLVLFAAIFALFLPVLLELGTVEEQSVRLRPRTKRGGLRGLYRSRFCWAAFARSICASTRFCNSASSFGDLAGFAESSIACRSTSDLW